ncbi:MAG: hypothetical protein ACYCX1_01905 [Bellilinea sp.]
MSDGSQLKSSKVDGYLETTGIQFIKLRVMGIGLVEMLNTAYLLDDQLEFSIKIL